MSLSTMISGDAYVVAGERELGYAYAGNNVPVEQRILVDEMEGGAPNSHNHPLHAALSEPLPLRGSDECPCWMDTDSLPPISFADLTDQAKQFLGTNLPFMSYGYGCDFHDYQISQACQDGWEDSETTGMGDTDSGSSSAWCERAWCWVDPNRCHLQNRRSISYINLTRYYSYATCRYVDSFDAAFRRFAKPLTGRTMKVGFNHNTGGYVGAFSTLERNFDGNLSDWSGPVVDFALEAAEVGGFTIEVVPPPDFLLNRSLEFFGGSRFSYCAYATELGFLDFCLAQYTITNSRAWAAKWVTLGPQELRLIVMNEGPSNSQLLADTIQMIFLPFETSTWLFICLFVIPVLGLLMVVHERGQRGSAYPTTVAAVCDETERGGLRNEVQERRIPIWRQMVRSVYVSFLSTLQGAYSKRVVTLGAHFNLLAISFAIVLIVEVYVANLMAILTERAKQRPIESLDDVRDRRLRICSIRTGYEVVNSIHGIPGSFFVKDPLELGGDDQPGFNCADCNVAQRVFDFLDPVKAETDDRYCHVAVTQQQDLEVLQGNGRHCNKTFVGDVVGSATTGFPVHSPEVLSFLQGFRSEGSYMKLVLDAKPRNVCASALAQAPTAESLLEGTAFNINELSGIWVLGFGLALIGLLVTLYVRVFGHCSKKAQRVKYVVGYDQHGEVVNRVSRRNSHLDGLLDWVDVSFNNGVFEVSSKKLSSPKRSVKSVTDDTSSTVKSRVLSSRRGFESNKFGSLPSSDRRLPSTRLSWYEREKSSIAVAAILEEEEEVDDLVDEELCRDLQESYSSMEVEEEFFDEEAGEDIKASVEVSQASEEMHRSLQGSKREEDSRDRTHKSQDQEKTLRPTDKTNENCAAGSLNESMEEPTAIELFRDDHDIENDDNESFGHVEDREKKEHK